MTRPEETPTDVPPPEEAETELPADAGEAVALLRDTSFALVGAARAAALGIVKNPSGANEAAQLRKLTAISLSMGRIADMEDRLEGKSGVGEADNAQWRREIRKLLDLEPDLLRRVLDKADLEAKRAGDRCAPTVGSAEPMERAEQ